MAARARGTYPGVVLGLDLGQESGLDVFEAIRDRFPAVSVVIVAGHGSFRRGAQGRTQARCRRLRDEARSA
jgi:ActR/RegA family two-component response regulator